MQQINRNNNLVPGTILILIGLYFIFINFGIPFLSKIGININISSFWPIIFLFISLGFLLPLLLSPDRKRISGLAIPGIILLGQFFIFSYFSLTNNWWQWSFLWPAEPFFVGLSFYISYLFGNSKSILIPGTILIILSAMFFAFSSFMHSNILNKFIAPAFLVVFGVSILFIKRE